MHVSPLHQTWFASNDAFNYAFVRTRLLHGTVRMIAGYLSDE